MTPGPSPLGQWSALMTWPMVAVHSVLLKNGNVLQWDGWSQPEPTQVWNPATQTVHEPDRARQHLLLGHDARCPTVASLVVGGYGGASTGQARHRRHDHLRSGHVDLEPRRQHGLAALVPVADRAGRRPLRRHQRQHDATRTHWADTPEVYNPATNTWTQLTDDLDVAGARGGVPVLVPGPERQGVHDRAVGRQVVPARRRRAAWTAGRRSERRRQRFERDVPARARSSTAVARRTSSPTCRRRRRPRSSTSTPPLPTWRQTAPMKHAAHLPHADDAGRRQSARGRRRATSSDQDTNVTDRHAAHRDLGPDVGDVDRGRADRGGAQLPLDRAAAARRYRARRAAAATCRRAAARASSRRRSTRRRTCSTGRARRSRRCPRRRHYGDSISVATPDAASISAVNLVSLGADTHQLDMDQHFVPLELHGRRRVAAGAGARVGRARAARHLHAVPRQRQRRAVDGRDAAPRRAPADRAGCAGGRDRGRRATRRRRCRGPRRPTAAARSRATR